MDTTLGFRATLVIRCNQLVCRLCKNSGEYFHQVIRSRQEGLRQRQFSVSSPSQHRSFSSWSDICQRFLVQIWILLCLLYFRRNHRHALRRGVWSPLVRQQRRQTFCQQSRQWHVLVYDVEHYVLSRFCCQCVEDCKARNSQTKSTMISFLARSTAKKNEAASV